MILIITIKFIHKMPYKFLENLTLADVAFEARGKTLEGLFISTAQALAVTQVKSLRSIKPLIKKEIFISAIELEELLFKFLDELVFLKDKDLLIFSKFKLKIEKIQKKVLQKERIKDGMKDGMKDKQIHYHLNCTAYGQKLNRKKHEMLVDVKAVTMHMFSVSKVPGGWMARVVLDV